MVKVRMNTADVAAEVKCLRRLIGMRCSNVYDLSPKTYIFKLMNSSGVTESGESEKTLLLMESGVRLHTTAYARDKSNTPSNFTLKLRKHVRTRRLEDVRQLGYDRIVLFQFGLGANAFYVILELYAQGNIILTDSDFTVMTLLRSHRDDDKGIAIMSRHRYPVETSRVFERTTVPKLENALDSLNSVDGSNQEGGDTSINKDKKRRQKQATLKTVLGDVLGYGPALSEHIILDAGWVPSTRSAGDIRALTEAVRRFEDWLDDVISASLVPEGYILLQSQSNKTQDAAALQRQMIYDEFCPMLLNQYKARDSLKFETFDAALDEFYSKIESQKVEQQLKAKEGITAQKLQNIKADQGNRVEKLGMEVEHSAKMAELIEYNLEDVDAAIMAVRAALATGMSWDDLSRMVKDEKKSGNPVAALIDRLHLIENSMTLLLSNSLDDMEDGEKTLPVDRVSVDLSLSAHANARRWYELKKSQESKQEKTLMAHEKALTAAEKKTRRQASQEKSVATISHIRKIHWFEKFNWFISSENYLVISGRDAQQNEMIVKRYMSSGDLYVHADLHGASTTVVKNHRPDHPIPPLTLNQAGSFTVCHSQAWDSKIVTSAWWVRPDQVSKTAPTGEYLTAGSFMIRGKKNFLPHHPLVMGFGLLFRIDDSCLPSHLDERRVRCDDGPNGPDDLAEGEITAPPPDEPEHWDYRLPSTEKPHVPKSDCRREKTAAPNACSSSVYGKTQTAASASSSNRILRGQRGKLKKIKEKYADQDDEERELRMALLQSAGRAQQKKGDGDTPVAAAAVTATAAAVVVAKLCYRCRKEGHVSRDCPVRAEIVGGGDDDDGDEEVLWRLNELDLLTGKPLPDDVLLYAVPVCGPYSALQSYKYRVKLVPGTVKKGKAVKAAMGLFSSMAEMTAREKELMKACTDPELVAAIVGNVKVTAAGLSQLKKNDKNAKKNKKNVLLTDAAQ